MTKPHSGVKFATVLGRRRIGGEDLGGPMHHVHLSGLITLLLIAAALVTSHDWHKQSRASYQTALILASPGQPDPN